MKNIYRYLITIILLIVVLLSVVTYRYEIADRMTLLRENNYLVPAKDTFIDDKEEIFVSEVNQTQIASPLNIMYKAENTNVDIFSLSYGNSELKVGDKLKRCEAPYASDQLNMIFKKTYPSISLEEMGVKTVEEAYMIKQLALWELAFRTGESKYGTELSYVDSVRNDLKLKDETIFRKAEELIRYIEEFDYTDNEEIDLVSTLTVKTLDVKNVFYENGGYIAGPYKYTVTAGELVNCEVTALDNNGNDIGAQILESNGKIKTEFAANDEFYVKCPNNKDDLIVTVKTDVKRLNGVFFEAENGDDYVINAGIDNHMEQPVTIHWTT